MSPVGPATGERRDVAPRPVTVRERVVYAPDRARFDALLERLRSQWRDGYLSRLETFEEVAATCRSPTGAVVVRYRSGRRVRVEIGPRPPKPAAAGEE